ncbi:hypothetical protein [Coleofasciculus sp. E2-BRE-01]|uniref:hypothetical protein n=1 Tax=Coleofasciculus sp. E2-BRE-01 TaxID=3069524 RepID=UPI003302030B
MADNPITQQDYTIPEEDWRVAHTRIEEKLRRNAQTQKGWTLMDSATLVDAAKLLGESDAPPPTPEELRWLRDNLLEHQQAVEKLIKLIDSLLNR